MIKKIFFLTIVCLLMIPSQAKITNSLILNTKISGKENLKIYKTPLSDQKQITSLKLDIKSKEDYLNIINPKILKKNKNRPRLTKFKGASEDIYKEYSNSVVFIGNRKKNGMGSGFIIDYKGKKIITNWHVIEGAEEVDVWLKPKNLADRKYMINNQESYNAKVIKIDDERDLALLEVY